MEKAVNRGDNFGGKVWFLNKMIIFGVLKFEEFKTILASLNKFKALLFVVVANYDRVMYIDKELSVC